MLTGYRKLRTGTLLLLAFFVSAIQSNACAQAHLRDTLLSRYRQYLFRTANPGEQTVNKWKHELNAAGQWPDINYADTDPGGWKLRSHLERLKEMAWGWANPASPHYHNQLLWEKINAALDHWLAHRYQSSNWWQNEIGVPRWMRDIIILLRNDLTPQRLKQSMEVLSQMVVHDDYVAGNLIWGADLGLHYGALTGNDTLIHHCRNLVLNEIKIGRGEGIQPDYSFQQHGRRLQMYQYGKAYLCEAMRMAWQCRETALAFPQEKLNILTDFVTNGWQWMARGIHTVPGTMDRSASRKGELQSADLRALLPFIIELQPGRAAELQTMLNVQNGQGALSGFRYYPYSDFAVWHRPHFSFFLKTISARTHATESINRENLKGKLFNSGDAYLIRNGCEYFNLLPVWDWTALPGLTTWKVAHQANRNDFTGSVSDSLDGFTAMDYSLKDQTGKSTLAARKLWACHGDVVVCLVSSPKTTNITGPVYTALDQCRWQGAVTVNKKGRLKKAGEYTLNGVKWLHHAGFAYIPLQPASLQLHMKVVEGSWTNINAGETTIPLKDSVFMPVLLHEDSKPMAYVLAYSETPQQAATIAARPNWKIIRNDDSAQAVLFSDGTLMAAFYKAGKVQDVQVDQPCLVMLKKGKMILSDPTHKGITVTIHHNNSTTILPLPKDGFSIIQ
jgi:Polysaccharide lyase family 8, C-terminal beta-sandwich domain./Polysaccharide lyase family 8, super-sandwich domain./Polysaccharide lyase family 8, N terminal alpha-helical domain.